LSHQSQAPTSTEHGSAPSTSKSPAAASKAGRKSAYFWGAASGVAFALFAPMLRPAARTAVKGGLRVGRYAKKLAANVKEEFEDIAMEAQADLDGESKAEKD
jgi:hypothetical protein